MQNFSELISQSKFLPFAHRGASRLAPENTYSAFQIAYDLGYKIIETDIRSSLDGVLYCFHDSSLFRMTGEKANIESLHSKRINQLRIQDLHTIPKLQDLYEAFPEAYFNLDAKSWRSVKPLITLTKKMNTAQRTCFGSFNQGRINALAGGLCPISVTRSLGTRGAIGLYLSYLSGKSFGISANCAQLPLEYYGLQLINPKTLKYFKSLGLKVYTWTINQPTEMQRLIDLGVDGIMTDNCVGLKSVLEENKLW